MRIGCNVRDAEQAEVVIRHGLDYIEMNLCRLVTMEEDEFLRFAERIDASPIKIEVFNLLLPFDGSIPIIGPEASEEKQCVYFEKAFARAARLGAQLMVFGSARARAVPQGYPADQAHRELIGFLRRLMGYADRYGITMVIEPVCGKEAENPVKVIPDAVRLCEEVDHPALFALCDLYHMYYENEPMENIVKAGSWIRHAHISGIDEGRRYPTLDDGYDYGPFFDALKRAGYDDRLTMECFDMNIDAGIRDSMPLLKKYC